MEITILLYHRWHTSVNRERNILKISQSAKWQTRDEEERAFIVNILDDMFAPLEKNYGDIKGGDIGNRIGNEIMIDAKDLA